MIIFLYGQDGYRLRQKLNEITEHYKKIHKSGLNLKFFDCKSLELECFKNENKITSMFKEKKLIVFKNIFSNSENEEKILNFIKETKNLKDIILIYEEKGIDKRKTLFKFLKKYGKTQEFEPLEGQRLRSWIKKEFENHQAEIEPEALDQFINFISNNLWQVSNEIKKLSSFRMGEKINKKDIELLVKPKIDIDIFKTIDALAAKNKKQALVLLHKHLENGDNPLYLLSMINFQFRNLLMVKELIEKGRPYYFILKATELHPFVFKKSYQQADRFSFQELKKIYQKIFQVDLTIKTGKIKPETALDLFVARI